MDRNSIIGFVLIALLLFAYFTYFAPSPEAKKQNTTYDSLTVVHDQPIQAQKQLSDSLIKEKYGSLASSLSGKAVAVEAENEDLRITFTTKGGNIEQVELRKFKTYSQEPLFLIKKDHNQFKLFANIEGRETGLHELFYKEEKRAYGDTTLVTFTASPEGSGFIRHIYKIPSKGYEIRYKLETSYPSFNKDLRLEWYDKIPLVEKDLADSRSKTNINYFTSTGEFDGLSDTSLDPELMPLPSSVNWVAIKQKFFLSAIIATKSFSGGEIATTVEDGDPMTVKDAAVKLSIPSDAKNGFAARYYFGPNDYKTVGDVAEGFSKNVYLGWPPVKWVNQFFIVPVFHFLASFISNLGWIIFILVIFVRIVLLPLSYKSYLGMAKMRLLKPELDELKKKFPDQAKFSQEQMKLYTQAGASPFSGCIPLLLQMPILFAMFYLFPSSIEFRQESLWWASDLSTYDSNLSFPFTIPFLGSHLSIFTLLMTLSTLVITWQNNQITTVEGPMKAMSYIMPVIFLFVLNSFPASLSFYYLVSNVVSFAQQILIKRFVDEGKIKVVMEEHKRKMATGTSKKSSFMARLEGAMKAGEEARKKNKK